MPRLSGHLETILASVVARLIATVSGCTASNCYLSLNPDAKLAPSSGALVYVVAPTSGDFDEGMYDGGGLNQLTAYGGIVVKIHSPMQLDKPQDETTLLTHATRGVLQAATAVIAALADPAWSPSDGTNEITRDPLIPAGYTIGRESRSPGWLELRFKCNFDWKTP